MSILEIPLVQNSLKRFMIDYCDAPDCLEVVTMLLKFKSLERICINFCCMVEGEENIKKKIGDVEEEILNNCKQIKDLYINVVFN